MKAKKFIDEKSDILAKYLDLFLMKKLTYAQLNHFMWDTLREWDNLDIYDASISSCKEQVFWFLLFELQSSSSQQIFANRILLQKLHTSALFLQGQGAKPYNCIGIRAFMDSSVI